MMAVVPKKKMSSVYNGTCFIPGCKSDESGKRLVYFSMSFGDLPYWWNSTRWVAKHKTELPPDALICETHFEERFIDRSRKRPRLFVGTIPTVNLDFIDEMKDEGPSHPMEFLCRLCAKQSSETYKTRIQQLNSTFGSILNICLEKYAYTSGLPQGVCDECTQVLSNFAFFVAKCEQSQSQLAQLAGTVKTSAVVRKDSDKENSRQLNKFKASANKKGAGTLPNKRKRKLGSPGNRTCPKCGKTFKNLASYNNHINNHDEVQQYVCQICDAQFPIKDKLRTHLEIVHERKSLSCMHCKQHFDSSEQLETHLEQHKENKFRCNICGADYIYKGGLKRHAQRIHGITIKRMSRHTQPYINV